MVTVDVVTAIAAEVLRRESISGIRIVGIDGRSGSGKSVLAAGLSSRLGVPIIEIDDFVCGAVSLIGGHASTPRSSHRCWPARMRRSRRETGPTGTDHRWVNGRPNRGRPRSLWRVSPAHAAPRLVGSCTPPGVDASAELRLARGLARDSNFPGKEQLWERWMAEEDTFFAADATRDRADVVVDTARVETIAQQTFGDVPPPTPGASA